MKSAPAPVANPTREQLTIKPKQVELIGIKSITGCVQLRAGLDDDTIKKYAEIYRADEGKDCSLPPIVVFAWEDELCIADGNHRFAAAKGAKLHEIPAIVKNGDVRAATEYALESNHDHGLPLTNADKRSMVKVLLNDDTWAKWSDREISRRCRVSPTFVGELRAKTPKAAAITTRKDKHGKERTIAKKPTEPKAIDKKMTAPLIMALGDPADKANQLSKLAKTGADTAAIIKVIDKEFGDGGGRSSPECGSVSFKGGSRREIVFESLKGQPSLRGKDLVDAVRHVYLIPEKGQVEPAVLGPDSITATKDTDAEKPITVTKPVPLKQRRLEWMREHVAAKLTIGKVGACSMTEAAALSLIVGVFREAETRWSNKLLERVGGQFIEAVALMVADALTKYTDGRYPEALSRLPDLPDLCRIYKIDHDALVINAERTVTE